MFMRKILIGGGIALVASVGALAAGVDAALITSVQGKVVVGDKPATPFTKLQAGSVVSVEQGGKVQLVYFSSNKKEGWSGVAKFKVGGEKSEATTGKPEEVSNIPAVLTSQLLNSADSVSTNRVGMVRLRANPLKVEEIQRNYQEYKKQNPQSFIAEAYALGAYVDAKQFTQAEGIINQLRTSYPKDGNALALVEQYQTEVANGLKSAAK